jgi:hypothetical protein
MRRASRYSSSGQCLIHASYNGWDGSNCSGTNLYGGSGPGGDSAPGRAYKGQL